MDTKYSQQRSILNDVVLLGSKEGFKASLKIIKIMIPISLIIEILKYMGFVKILGALVSPFIKSVGLSGETILVLISGYFINCYSAIAVMMTLPITLKEITILSTMVLICHTLPIELMIQKKAGGSYFGILFIRVFSSFLIGIVLNLVIPNTDKFMDIPYLASIPQEVKSFKSIMFSWLASNVVVVKIVLINIIITIFYKLLVRVHVVEKISNAFKYVMFIFGLSREVAFLWIITNVIGLMYGASILIEFNDKKIIKESDLKKLNISIATCHSLIQETANFVTTGAPIIFLVIPRIIVAIISVWLYHLFLLLEKLNLKVYKVRS